MKPLQYRGARLIVFFESQSDNLVDFEKVELIQEFYKELHAVIGTAYYLEIMVRNYFRVFDPRRVWNLVRVLLKMFYQFKPNKIIAIKKPFLSKWLRFVFSCTSIAYCINNLSLNIPNYFFDLSISSILSSY